MSNQTIKNDPINSGEEGHSELENKLCLLWLGRRDSNPALAAFLFAFTAKSLGGVKSLLLINN